MDLQDSIAKLENQIKYIVEELGWSYDDLKKMKGVPNVVTCPFNSEHRMPQESLENHIEKCSWNWKSEGYTVDDCPLPEGSHCSSSILLTVDLQEKTLKEAVTRSFNFHIAVVSVCCFLNLDASVINVITGGEFRRPVPKTSNRWQVGFTQDERLAIYDHVVDQTKRDMKLEEINFSQPECRTESKEMTALELAAAERDAKRRRATYRNKVHIGRKNHVEVLREVIQSQMTQLCDEIQEDPEIPQEKVDVKHQNKSSSYRSHSRSHESRRARSRSNDYARSSRSNYNDYKYTSKYDRPGTSAERYSRNRDSRHASSHDRSSEKRDRKRFYEEDSHRKDHRRDREDHERFNEPSIKQEVRTSEESASKRYKKVEKEITQQEKPGSALRETVLEKEIKKVELAQEGVTSLTDGLEGVVSFYDKTPKLEVKRHKSKSKHEKLSHKKKKKERHRKQKKEKKRKKKQKRCSSQSSSSSSSSS